MNKITPADVLALGDVINDVAEQSDSLTLEEAIAMKDALEKLTKIVSSARGLCDTQAKTLLDGQPAVVDGVVYVEKQTGKWRPNQSKIKGTVVRMSTVTSDGEIRETRAAVEQAVDLMYALFVAPSQMPKVGGMQKLGIESSDVAEWEHTGSELKAIAT